ncbi:transmembrane protein 52-like [Polypterus senegalus]|uniref:transmembrane protein 52-like n=1 Tax=Polypterus senegalus TaxID=55291 RepID=UPI001965582B|nr:transmembrane protein 52-like [Polypterus senegalus]
MCSGNNELLLNSMEAWATLGVLALQIFVAEAQNCYSSQCNQSVNWTNLWYVWVILVGIFLLLMCGATASCFKFFCMKKHSPLPSASAQPYDISVVSTEELNAVSIASSHGMQQSPGGNSNFPTGIVNVGSYAPPPYNLCALENPPPYYEALKMPFDLFEYEQRIYKPTNQQTEEDHAVRWQMGADNSGSLMGEIQRSNDETDGENLEEPPEYHQSLPDEESRDSVTDQYILENVQLHEDVAFDLEGNTYCLR